MDFAGLIEIKSKFDAEFRRFSIASTAISTFRDFYQLLERRHGLYSIPFVIQYVDPKDNDLLPINNDENLARALKVTTTLLRLLLQRKGESYGEINGYRSSSQGIRGKKAAADLVRSMGGSERKANHDRAISLLDDFRKVSSIIDIDIVPETMRRVRLIRSDAKPLGFFIRDGVSVRVTPTGIERVPGIFISRLNPGGLAESTGLLAVNDEVRIII
ncbi:unnamed protein product [Protopolystoma xenopodis]|uniref:Uncharacterized protein n=1 Tax=Protopolystoma xenopodis TaxID=117903 RepID=A0A3S5ACY9_9PLAT|nr:unnamed protein product [Protopolystoma xenopodis]